MKPECSIKYPEKTSQRWPIFRRGTVRLNLKSIRSHICFFFSVIEAQTFCKCFIGLFIMSLIFKRSRSTLAMLAKSCCGGVGWRVHFLQMCKEMRLYFLQF